MGGTVAPGELTRTVRFAIADVEDEAAIRRLLRENPMRGAVSVTFEREPDYFGGSGLAGGEDQTIVAYENERLVCVGRCTRRECWVGGQGRNVSYLSELRLDQAARRRFALVRDGYRFFREQQDDGLHFTSIATDNVRARRLLESGVRGLPAYEFLGELVTVLVAVPRRPRPSKLSLDAATAEDIPTILRLLNQHGQRHSFATVWTDQRLQALGRHGLPLEGFLLTRQGGEAVGCGALWDQRQFRQVVIRGYGGALRLARPWLEAASVCLGLPGLPVPGQPLAQAFVSPLAFAEGAEMILVEFLSALLPRAAAAGLEWITVALPAGDGRLAALRKRFYTRRWPTRLYGVRWPDQPSAVEVELGARCLPDVALL